MMKILMFFTLWISFLNISVCQNNNYHFYHQQVIEVESQIAKESFVKALEGYQNLFDAYEFVFLRDFKVAAQLALLVGDSTKALNWIALGMEHGWSKRSLQSSSFLKPLLKTTQGKFLLHQSDSLEALYQKRINWKLRVQVNEMFRQDQKMAFGALFRIGNKAQERYGVKKFAPHSIRQMDYLQGILTDYSYPGEKLIGNNTWMSTIICHHNSSAKEVVIQDTIFMSLQSQLIKAFGTGDLSPFEYALMHDWRMAVINDHGLTSYGIVGAIPDYNSYLSIEKNRAVIGMRSIALRNELVKIEAQYGIDLLLQGEPWQNGKIMIPRK